MSKTNKLLIRIGVWAAVLAIAAIGGYFILFHDADVLKFEERPILLENIDIGNATWEELTTPIAPGAVEKKIKGLKPTWLTVHSDPADESSPYYKIADVSAPRNYSAVKDAADLDGDPFTTQFIYKGKTDKNPGRYTVRGVILTQEEIHALVGESSSAGFGPMELGKKEVTVYPVFETADAYSAIVCLIPSHYENIYIEVTLSLEGADPASWQTLCEAMVNKVTPAVQLHPLVADFKLNFIDENRWEFLVDGLGVTLLITLFSTILGIIIGVIVAGVCSTWDKNGERMYRGVGKFFLQLGNKICRVFLTVIRGTPVVIQLMLFYFVILVSVADWDLGFLGTVKSGVIVAIIAFGINSGAYVAEIIRGGIMSIDQGQFEAGRSLGFNYIQTMWHIIIPQALKNVLPSLANEFIVLLKETSVAGYVAVMDLTKAGDIIKGVTYSPFLPLIAVAIIYLILVIFFTWLVGKLERRLRNSER